MFCPDCNAEITDRQNRHCPQCHALLPKNSGHKILTNGPQADKQARDIQTGSKRDTNESQKPDAFDSFLEDITTEIGRLVASDKQNAAASSGQVPTDDEASEETPHIEIELTDQIEPGHETSSIDEPIDDLEELIQAFDELVENDLNDKMEAVEEDPPPTAAPDAVIELTDPIEPVGPPEDKLPAEGSDQIIDLLDIIEPAIDLEDEVIETMPDIAIQAVDEPEPLDFEGDELIEEITAQDFVSADVPGLHTSGDGEVITEISERDFVYIQPPAAKIEKEVDVELPVKPKRSSTAILAATSIIVLMIAAVLGAMLYFKSKQSSLVTPLKSSAVVVKKKAKKYVAPKKTNLERNLGPDAINMDKQPVATAITEPVVDAKNAAVAPPKISVDQSPLTTVKSIEQPPFNTPKSAPVPMAEIKASEPQAKIAPKPADEIKGLKGDIAGAYIRPGHPYFTIQVATLKSRAAAESSLAELQTKGYRAFVFEKMTPGGLMRYKLRIGKYKTKKEANKAAESYFDREQKPFIIVRSKEAI